MFRLLCSLPSPPFPYKNFRVVLFGSYHSFEGKSCVMITMGEPQSRRWRTSRRKWGKMESVLSLLRPLLPITAVGALVHSLVLLSVQITTRCESVVGTCRVCPFTNMCPVRLFLSNLDVCLPRVSVDVLQYDIYRLIRLIKDARQKENVTSPELPMFPTPADPPERLFSSRSGGSRSRTDTGEHRP